MVNKTIDSASIHGVKQHGETTKDVVRKTLKTKIKQLTKQILVERGQSVKEKIQRHWEHLELLFSMVMSIIFERGSLQTKKNVNMLSSKIHNPLDKFSGFPKGIVEKNQINNVDLSPTKSIRIPRMDKLPQYTCWVYVTRNERMVDDQSVIGKYQMYHDKNKGEMVICSDNEEEIVDLEDVKHEFTKAEDRILRMTLEEYGCTEEVLSVIKKSVKTINSQIQERYEKLKKKNMETLDQHKHCEVCHCRGCENHLGLCLEKSLSVTLETFDNLLCRQCLIFDCPMHGINKPLVYHSENLPVWFEPEGDKKPCSDQCYLTLKDARISSKNSTQWSFQDKVITTIEEGSILPSDDEENHTIYCASLKSLVEHTSKKLTISDSSSHDECDKGVVDGQKDLINEIKLNRISISREVRANGMSSASCWRPLEIDLYLKGVKIFGKNSCLIAITLLSGLKTCSEVARYMFGGGELMTNGFIPSSIMDKNEKINAECTDREIPSRSRSQRKKGKPKKFNYSRKSAGLPPRWRKIAHGQNLCNKQYTPCGCHGICGKECPCLVNGTCCEKYCGCSKHCSSRFRGCRCTKSQCKSRLCPCFAANRECDPDVCRNCWISCGDDSLGRLTRHEDSKCGNMNLLLGQKERILLAKSDVTGWGAFAKNPISKNACLGEYTGELIPPKEAEKRGKLYDRINTSFLFNLNDQWVIDAFRMGDKLKFANHSSKPNCYAKVMLVGGDHRVGIFAKENIKAGDEIFYDYCYDLDCAPLWALPPNEAAKKDELDVSLSRTKKKEKKSDSFQ